MNAQRSEFILESREHLSQFETSHPGLGEGSEHRVGTLAGRSRTSRRPTPSRVTLAYSRIHRHPQFDTRHGKCPVNLSEAMAKSLLFSDRNSSASSRSPGILDRGPRSFQLSADISDHLARLESFGNVPRNNSQRITIDLNSFANSAAIIQLCSHHRKDAGNHRSFNLLSTAPRFASVFSRAIIDFHPP